MKTIRIITLGLLALGFVAAKKDRAWQIGTVTDSRTVDIGAKPRQPRFYVGGSPPPRSSATTTLTTAELLITGVDYIYTVRDDGRKPCRYIVGDHIKYVQDKLVMYLIDADGAECRAQVMKQEHVPPPAPKP